MLRDFRQVLVIDAGNQHRVHLHQDAPRGQHLQPFLLLLDEDRRRLAAADAPVLPEDPRVDLRPDLRVDAVDGDRHVVDVVPGEFVDVLAAA
jgi:hypothetical protein